MCSDFRDFIEISADSLPSLDYVTSLVHDDGAGAISTFSGTTRDTFEGKGEIENSVSIVSTLH